MVHEGFRTLAAAFQPTKVMHLFVVSVEMCRVLAAMDKTSAPLARFDGSDIHIVGGTELLGLRSGKDFIVEQYERPFHVQPDVVDEK